MSTRVPAPLYTYSPAHGFRSIDSEPEGSASKKSGSGLMNKLGRLLHPRPATQPSPTNSTVAESPENSSTITDESRPEESPDPIALRILTWNIWFENSLKEQRTSALIRTIKSLNPLPDVCCFQECTKGFESQLQGDDWWRETWAMTKCVDQFTATTFSYGTMVFVRRELIEKMEFKAKAWFEPFEVTQNGRGLLVLELTTQRSVHPVGTPTRRPLPLLTPPSCKLLIATSHMDYAPEIRATQFAAAISALSTTPTSVFCGDTNIDTHSELGPLLSAGYVDSWLETHSDVANSPDLAAVGATFGTTGLRFSGSLTSGDLPPRRLDYVMARGMMVVNCELVGEEPIPKEEWARSSQEQELDLEVNVSDHLGVIVDVKLG